MCPSGRVALPTSLTETVMDTCTTQFLPGFESLISAAPLPQNANHARRGRSGKRGVLYTTSTETVPGSSFVVREIRASVWAANGPRCASIRVQADSDRIGYGFGTMLLRGVDGQYLCVGMDAEQMRSVGAALLAAANSCGAKWRK